MSRIERHETSEGEISLSRNGRWLCSPRGPLAEARNWVTRQLVQVEDKVVLILGGGAGYHATLLQEQYPRTEFRVVEIDNEIPDLGNRGTLQWLTIEQALSLGCENYNLVLNFRPAWGGIEAQYMNLYFKLTQNSPESLSVVARNMGKVLTAESLERKNLGIDFSLKDLSFHDSDSDAAEVKMWKALRELIE